MPKAQIEVKLPPLTATEDSTSRARTVLEHSVKTCNHFLNLFRSATSDRGPGAPSDSEQDLLRAMLLFACAGLDSAAGHLMRDCAVELLPRSESLRKSTRSFASRELDMSDAGAEFLFRMLDKAQPGVEHLVVEEMMEERTRHSLQSHEELLNMCSLFEFNDKGIERDILKLRDVFKARNIITHEMDIDFNRAPNRSRVSRRRDDMVEYTTRVLKVAAQLIDATQKKLR